MKIIRCITMFKMHDCTVRLYVCAFSISTPCKYIHTPKSYATLEIMASVFEEP